MQPTTRNPQLLIVPSTVDYFLQAGQSWQQSFSQQPCGRPPATCAQYAQSCEPVDPSLATPQSFYACYMSSRTSLTATKTPKQPTAFGMVIPGPYSGTQVHHRIAYLPCKKTKQKQRAEDKLREMRKKEQIKATLHHQKSKCALNKTPSAMSSQSSLRQPAPVTTAAGAAGTGELGPSGQCDAGTRTPQRPKPPPEPGFTRRTLLLPCLRPRIVSGC